MSAAFLVLDYFYSQAGQAGLRPSSFLLYLLTYQDLPTYLPAYLPN